MAEIIESDDSDKMSTDSSDGNDWVSKSDRAKQDAKKRKEQILEKEWIQHSLTSHVA